MVEFLCVSTGWTKTLHEVQLNLVMQTVGKISDQWGSVVFAFLKMSWLEKGWEEFFREF